jgi:hypothetical protein
MRYQNKFLKIWTIVDNYGLFFHTLSSPLVEDGLFQLALYIVSLFVLDWLCVSGTLLPFLIGSSSLLSQERRDGGNLPTCFVASLLPLLW